MAAAGPVAIALAMLAAPAGGAFVGHTVTHLRPFVGTILYDKFTHGHGCGAKATFSTDPFFNMTTGIGVMAPNATTRGCGLSYQSDDAAAFGETGFLGPVFVAAGSTENYSARFIVNVSWSLNATPANPSGGPFAWASDEILWHMGLIDLDNNSVTLGGCYGAASDTTNSSATGVVTGSWNTPCPTAPFLNKVVAGHHLAMEFEIQLYVWAHSPGGTPTHAFAKMNLATLGRKLIVTWWKLS